MHYYNKLILNSYNHHVTAFSRKTNFEVRNELYRKYYANVTQPTIFSLLLLIIISDICRAQSWNTAKVVR